MADKLMYIPNDKIIHFVVYNKWLKRLDTKLNEPTNKDLINVLKVVKPTNKTVNFGY